MKHTNPFYNTASFYDVLYKHKKYSGEAGILHKIIKRYDKNPKTLLDLGCGTAKHAIAFSRLGYQVTGIDRSKQMLNMAKQNTNSARVSMPLIYSSIANYRSSKQFDVVVALFHVLSYQTTNNSVASFFKTMGETLKPGGVGIFDCWYGPGILLHKPITRTQQYVYQNKVIQKTTTPVWKKRDNLVRVMHTFKTTTHTPIMKEIHTMRYFFLPELRVALAKAGLHILEWGNLSAHPTTMKSTNWDIWFIVQKKQST